MRFEELVFQESILQGINAAGFEECTPVQAAALPIALAGKDVAVQAQTGTGKTAAFLITVFSRMLAQPSPGAGPSPRALVIAPTRELVSQIHAEASVLGKYTGFNIVPVFGGIDYLRQRDALSGNVDMLIGTPGRLIDYLKQKVYSLKKTEFLVIDEADRMFDMGFISDLRFLLRRISPYDKRQSMLFSATLSTRVMELCYEHMNLPEEISITPEQVTVEKIEQELYHVGQSEKFGLLLGLLRRAQHGRILIFVNTRAMAERLEALLNANNYRTASITGEIPQRKRMMILDLFKRGELPIMVATDVASRGLHIEGVTHVINYDLPQDREDYVHRIGRTARAGAEGKAISLACEEYVHSLEDIEDYIKQKIPVRPLDDALIITDYKRPHGRPQRRGQRPAFSGVAGQRPRHRGTRGEKGVSGSRSQRGHARGREKNRPAKNDRGKGHRGTGSENTPSS
jgi:ATP-dependent RNA helicase RhlB